MPLQKNENHFALKGNIREVYLYRKKLRNFLKTKICIIFNSDNICLNTLQIYLKIAGHVYLELEDFEMLS